ncbi:MAG TPA: cobalamin-binding protein [Alphaproteobacteria bacterium]|nr:cobalamin-binding protein [Alphaproteobacteria bacterium]
MSAPRIASLLPSGTEIVCALGFREALVGRSHECDFPGGLAALPVLTQSAFAGAGTSAAIDRDIRRLVEDGLSIYRVDADRLRALAPDLIVTQDQCKVCAVSLDAVTEAVAEWTGAAPDVVSLVPAGLDTVWTDFARVAAALDAEPAGAALIAGLQARIEGIAGRAATLDPKPRVACIEWIEPLMAAGNWIPELVALAGGEDIFGVAGAHAPWIDAAALAQADPDVIVVMPCGFGIERAAAEMAALEAQAFWPSLKAVRAGRVFLVDANHYFSRPGPRLVDSLEILAEIFHPGVFGFGHGGSGWRAL